ncbi:hypothetical protein AAE026_22905 [Bradyrhizobium sp. DN5]|uniref:hypothetical protein n=1 Tax=Bradyrhizobium sp. DN5 TaxID=3056950 RepID=UPI00352418CE
MMAAIMNPAWSKIGADRAVKFGSRASRQRLMPLRAYLTSSYVYDQIKRLAFGCGAQLLNRQLRSRRN